MEKAERDRMRVESKRDYLIAAVLAMDEADREEFMRGIGLGLEEKCYLNRPVQFTGETEPTVMGQPRIAREVMKADGQGRAGCYPSSGTWRAGVAVSLVKAGH